MYPTWDGTFEQERTRVTTLAVMMVAGGLLLMGHLWNLQVRLASEHRLRHERQSVRRVRLPGQRGAIYDRRGRCLAGNRPSFSLVVYVEELRVPGSLKRTLNAVERTLDDLTIVLGRARRVTREDILSHVRRRLALPLVAWSDLDEEALARWAEHRARFPAVDLSIEPIRAYPWGPTACHVLGHVGRRDIPAESEETFDFYLPEMEGRAGIELAWDRSLSGATGGRLIRVDATGFHARTLQERPPGVGADLTLTLDLDIQRWAEEALQGVRGAAVVLDPRNGDVLALASAPAYDPNRFAAGLSAAEWQQVVSDPDRPLLNRAVSAGYPPGSTFKPLVALAALAVGAAHETTAYACPGYFELGAVRVRCWNEQGHGPMLLRQALEQSCNSYFCQMGLRAGPEAIIRAAVESGFGRVTGLDLPGETPGLVPDAAWKRQTLRDAWRSGDTCNLSIGQGALLVTPLQMAVFTAALANGGILYRPRLIRDPDHSPVPMGRVAGSPEQLRIVCQALKDVIESPTGTGQRARIEGIPMAGKTGTAEYGPRTDRRRYAWMTVFAPYEDPQYAAVVVIEDAISGGRSAAPRIRFLMQNLFGVGAGMPGEALNP